MATLIQKLKAVKSWLVKDFGNLIKTHTKGANINTKQYNTLGHQPKGKTYNWMIANVMTTTINQTATYTLVGIKPHTMGKVLHPNFSSPSISSISFNASLTNVKINAKAAYNNINLKNLKFTVLGLAYNTDMINEIIKRIKKFVSYMVSQPSRTGEDNDGNELQQFLSSTLLELTGKNPTVVVHQN